MSNDKPKTNTSAKRNDARPNGKAWKKHPRTGGEGCNGKTIDGYSPLRELERDIKRVGTEDKK